MANLEKLVRDHAYWADLRAQLKKQGSEEIGKCTRVAEYLERSFRGLPLTDSPQSCIESVFEGYRDTQKDNPYDDFYFDEIWSDAVLDGDVCQHCQNVRDLKKQRTYAGRRLGIVHSAMTRVGRRIAAESGYQEGEQS